MENDPPRAPPPNIWNFPYVSSFFLESFPYCFEDIDLKIADDSSKTNTRIKKFNN